MMFNLLWVSGACGAQPPATGTPQRRILIVDLYDALMK
jgi:hypothetical protein